MRYRLLGPLEVIGDDGAAVALGGRERVLVAALVLRANQVVSSDQLVDALWGDDPPATATNALQVHVSKLRKKLPRADAGENLSSASKGYVLSTAPGDVDLEEFEQLAGAAAGDPAHVSTRLREALTLWRGPALADVTSDLLRGEKSRIEELRLLTVERCIEAELAMGRHTDLVGELEALVQASPLREGPRRQLMLALYRSGRQADALVTYRAAQEVLAEELGIDPGPELQALELAILNQDPNLAAPAAHPPKAFRPVPPSGTITLLLSDIEGSTRLWEEHPDAMALALRRHDDLMQSAIEGAGGYVFKTVGDAFCAAFATAKDAIGAAEVAQRSLFTEPWPEDTTVRVRMGLHTGECEERDGDYFGPAVNRVSRLSAIGHGGQVLVSRSTADIVLDHLPSGVTLRNTGTHRLKDLSRPEMVFQLEFEGLPSDFPPLRSLDNPALLNNLPEFVSSFVGRDAETVEVRKLVTDNRLVTLIGAGGAGKTRLALQVAAELLDGSGDGVWLVELASVTDPDAVAMTVASALGIAERPGRDSLDTLVDVLASQHRLIVLDNCEHLVDSCAKLADSILRHCSRIHALATSREPLRIDGEVIYRVPPLSLPPEDAEDVDLSDSGAVTLFVDRAQNQVPGFTLGQDDGPLVASICRRLDGMPLAIELASARLRSMTLTQLDDGLEQRFGLLTGGSRAALPRQQTLRALVDWSYDLLSDAERRLLQRLSVFVGGFDLEAAEAVSVRDDLSSIEVADLIPSLVDKSLVHADPSVDTVRFGMLETLRQYGVERLAETPGAIEALRDDHAAYFLALAESAAPHLTGSTQNRWIKRLDAELTNLRTAASHFVEAGFGIEALRLFGITRHYWLWSSRLGWPATLNRQALDLAGDDVPPALRSAALICQVHVTKGFDFAESALLARQAVGFARAAGDRALEAEALGLECYIAYFLGAASRQGSRKGEEAVAIARELEDESLLAETLMYFAAAIWSEEIYEEALSVVERAGDRIIAYALHSNYACFLLQAGRVLEARQHWERALALNTSSSSSRHRFIMSNLAFLLLDEGDTVGAESCLSDGLRSARLSGGTHEAAYNTMGLGICASLSGATERAAVLHGGANALLDGCGAQWEYPEKKFRDRDIADLQERLGDDFEGLFGEGERLSFEAIVDLALGQHGSSS